MKKIGPALLLAWWFLNAWPNGAPANLIGPFRSLSQCRLLQKDVSLTGAHKNSCENDSQANPDGWWFFISGGANQGGALTLASGVYPDQPTCDALRTAMQAAGGQDSDIVSATCWPSK